jgi:hypothetical protein
MCHPKDVDILKTTWPLIAIDKLKMGHIHNIKFSTRLRVIPPANPASSPNCMANCPPQA